MTTNVIEMPTPLNVLAEMIRAAVARTDNGRHEWIEGTLDLAETLAEARGRFQSDKDFGHWLVDNELDSLHPHERIALIGMAEDLELTRRILDETKSTSWRLIWTEEIQPYYANVGKERPKISIAPEPASEPEERPAGVEISAPKPSRAEVSKRNPLFGLDRADEVCAIFQHDKTRTTIGNVVQGKNKSAGKDVWSLILAAMDAGFLQPNNHSVTKPNLRLLYSMGSDGYCKKYDLTALKHRKEIRDEILPAMLVNREAILAAPDNLENILLAFNARIANEARKAALDKRLDHAMAKMSPNEQEVFMYGERFWPVVDNRAYDYSTLCFAIWHFQDQLRWIALSKPGEKIGSQVIMLRQGTKWLQELAMRWPHGLTGPRTQMECFCGLIGTLADQYERSPEGECRRPPPPKIETSSLTSGR